jgi:hypothetical protein
VAVLAQHAATVAIGAGEVFRAVSYLKSAIAAEPGDAYLHLAIGAALEMTGDMESARQAFDHASKLGATQGDGEWSRWPQKRFVVSNNAPDVAAASHIGGCCSTRGTARTHVASARHA